MKFLRAALAAVLMAAALLAHVNAAGTACESLLKLALNGT